MNDENNILPQNSILSPQSRKINVVISEWLQQHSFLIVVCVMAIGFILRILPIGKQYLNPDECNNYLYTQQPNLYQVWLNNLPNAHPPLYFFILFLWKKISNSEYFLRLLSVLASTASIYIGYRWIEKCFGKGSALVMSLFLAFSPTLIWLSQEVRHYSILILFMSCALYYFQLMLDQKKILPLILSSAFLYLAILIHYSASFFVLALGIYSGYLVIHKELSKKLVISWGLCQLGALGIYGFLYRTQLSLVSKSAMRQETIQSWLASSYLNIHNSSLKQILLYPFERTFAVFTYLFASQYLSIPLAIAFILAAVSLILKNRFRIGILLALPFIANLGASMLLVYPYGGTRHNAFLVLFAYAGIAYLLGIWFEKKFQLILITGLIFLLSWVINPEKGRQFISLKNQRLELMQQARKYIEEYLPRSEPIFIDNQTSVLLDYYLAKNSAPSPSTFQKGFWQCRYAGYNFMSAYIWTFTADNFVEQFRNLFKDFALDSTSTIWIIDAGWGWNLRNELGYNYPELHFLRQSSFGENISIFQLSVKEILKLETSSERETKLSNALLILAKAMQNLKEIKYRTIFWPTDLGWDSLRNYWSDPNLTVVPLQKLYRQIAQEHKSLDEFLPAIVFWIFDDKKPHIQVFSFMNEKQNYIAAGYTFTLLYLDPDGIGAIYEIGKEQGSEKIINQN